MDRFIRFAFALAPIVALYLAATGLASSLAMLRGGVEQAMPFWVVIISIISALFGAVLFGLIVLAVGDMVLSIRKLRRGAPHSAGTDDAENPELPAEPTAGWTGAVHTYLDRWLKVFGLTMAGLGILQFGAILVQMSAQASAGALSPGLRVAYYDALLSTPETFVNGLALFGLGAAIVLLRKVKQHGLKGGLQTETL